MRTLRLVALVLGLLVVTAIASPWITLAANALGFSFKFSRVYNRVFEILLVVAILLGWRRLDLGNATQIGLRQRRWARDLGAGLLVGVIGVGAGMLVCWLGGAMVPELRYAVPKTIWKAAAGMLGAVLVGVGEEALFRGVLLRRFTADLGRPAGILLSTAIYAIVHALRPGGSRKAYPWAGVDRTLALFAPLAGRGVVPGVLGLFGLGLILVLARQRTGSLWTSIGIHAAWVAVFRVGRLAFDIRPTPVWLIGPGWPPLVGGVGGLVALAVTLGLVLARLRRERGLPGTASAPTLAR